MYNAAVSRGYTDVAAWLEANEGSDATVWDDEAVVELRIDIGKLVQRSQGWHWLKQAPGGVTLFF
jgi:hypothetical protein